MDNDYYSIEAILAENQVSAIFLTPTKHLISGTRKFSVRSKLMFQVLVISTAVRSKTYIRDKMSTNAA